MALPQKSARFLQKYELPILLACSFFLWIYFFRAFFTEQRSLIHDALTYYEHFKFFTDNLARGVWPLWESTRDHGIPTEFYLRRIGDFNPLYALIVLFKFLGQPFAQSYFLFQALYYFLGLFGFYLLAKIIFGNRVFAFVAFLLLGFSSLGTNIFCSFIILEFVPITWLFYFLLAFFHNPHRHHFLGAIFCLMVLVSTYIPFYFLTIMLVVFLGLILFYLSSLKKFWELVFRFIRTNTVFSAICLGLLLVSLIPNVLFLQELKTGDIVFPTRSFNAPTKDVMGVAIQRSEWGGIVPHAVVNEYLYDLKSMALARLYVPFFGLILLGLGVAASVNKRMIFFFLTAYTIFVISIYDSPVYQFLFTHVVIFKYFRNFQFFFWLAVLPLFVLLCVEHLRIWSEEKKARIGGLFFIVLLHAAGVAVIILQKTWVSGAVVLFLSLLFFLYFRNRRLDGERPGLLLVVWLLVVIQPVEVYSYLTRNAESFHDPDRYAGAQPFLQLNLPDETLARETLENDKAAVDKRTYFELYMGTKWFNYLYNNINQDVLWDYVNRKVILYDRAEWMDGANPDLRRLGAVLKENINTALVSDRQAAKSNDLSHPDAHARIVTNTSSEVKVLGVGVNSVRLKTHLVHEQFLVYNDNFHKDWQAFIDGTKVPITRANYAFKGVWVPAGEHVLSLQFGSMGKRASKYLIAAVFYATFGYLIYLSVHFYKRKYDSD